MSLAVISPALGASENVAATALIDVSAKIEQIKLCMPDTYSSIKDKAQAIGTEAYGWVRRGLRGEPNCFYAFEAGHVAGTPFNRADIMPEIARYMVQFGCSHIVIWATEGCHDVGATPSTKA